MVAVPLGESMETNDVSGDIGVISINICVCVVQKYMVMLPKQSAASDPVLRFKLISHFMQGAKTEHSSTLTWV